MSKNNIKNNYKKGYEKDYEKRVMDLERKKNEMLFEVSKEIVGDEYEENNDEYFGEFIPTEFKWISLDKQKKRANELSNKTKRK